jgi:DNA-binding CsgD family transcriptional regulator
VVPATSPARHSSRRLGLSELTVNDHLGSVYRKAGVSGREEPLARLC